MSAVAALEAARAAGVRVSLDGRDLSLRAAREPPSAVLASLREHKAEIVGLLGLMAAFPGATVEFRSATPIPDEPRLGDRVWIGEPRRRRW